jgi:hypothetical protein
MVGRHGCDAYHLTGTPEGLGAKLCISVHCLMLVSLLQILII